ncbi:MAG: hypothetical protein JO170_19260 [Verrucomicrobia bacterium]|nr:hypothetical protein [Verrucomicrobiota bacterium]
MDKDEDELYRRMDRQVASCAPVTELPAGRHSFEVFKVTQRADTTQDYDYIYVQLITGRLKISDRFPLLDDDFYLMKLKKFMVSIGCADEDFRDTFKMVGRTGKLEARQDGDKTYYEYLQPS